MKESILIVEDSKAFATILAQATQDEFDLEPVICRSMDQLNQALDRTELSYFAAVVDLGLPDASEGEAVDLILSKKIPTIVLTASFNKELRQKILDKDILDYLVKGGKVLEHILVILRRIHITSGVKVLVVDDAAVSRKMVGRLLSNFKYHVLEAENGEKALAVLEKHPDIKLVITDYHMPEMDGFDLITRIRQTYAWHELAIIGLSSSDRSNLTSQFLKIGANDFLYKSFSYEEFLCRVRQNIVLVQQFEEIKEASDRDHLTQLYNRRYFFKTAGDLFEVCKRSEMPMAIAMLDIDHFKSINDTHGHEAGDLVLREIANLLKQNSRRSDIVARYGGEEFIFFATNISKSAVPMFFKRLLRLFEALEMPFGDHILRITTSIGVVTKPTSSLVDMINNADRCLFEAKRLGRNQVVFEC